MSSLYGAERGKQTPLLFHFVFIYIDDDGFGVDGGNEEAELE